LPRKPRPYTEPSTDREVDFHGFTAAEMRAALNKSWAGWHGLKSVRIIHGTGQVLWRELHSWCAEKGIEFTLEAHQGSTLIHPNVRSVLPPAPSHRPLARLQKLAVRTEPTRRVNSTANASRPVHRIQDSPGPPADSNPKSEIHNPKSTDLFAQEFDRLARENPHVTRARKRGGG